MTLDEDVARKLQGEARRSGRSFKETVNSALRRALNETRLASSDAPYRVEARDLGRLRPGLSLDNVADLLEEVEGPLHR